MATLKNERYLRYILLLGEGGLLVLRRIVRREETINGQSLHCILLCKRASFQNILREQYEKLFPPNSTVNDDIETWDISLLMIVVRKVFWNSLSTHDRTYITVLHRSRNEIQGHSTELCMEDADYRTNMTDTTKALQKLAARIDQSTIDEVDNIISKADSSDIDIKSTIRHIQELNEFKIDLLKALESRFDMIISGISKIIATDYSDRLYRMEVIKQKQKTGKALKTIIRAKCDNKEKESEALELLLDFVEVVQQKNKFTKAEIIDSIEKRIAWYGKLTDQLLDDVLDWFTDLKDIPDASTGHAVMGCILIPIHFSSLTGLLELMTYMVGDNSRSRLSAISCTVSKILKFPCSFFWSVSTEDLQAVITAISGKSETDKSTVSRKIVLPFQSISLKGLTGIWRQFGDGKGNRRLVKISETLSKIFDAPISLTTNVDDLKQCVEALFISETKAGSKEKTESERDPANITEEVESIQTEETKHEQVNIRHSQEGLSSFAAEGKNVVDTNEMEDILNSKKVTGPTSDVENKQEEERLKTKHCQEMESTSELENKQEQERCKVSDAVSRSEIDACTHPSGLDRQSVVSKKKQSDMAENKGPVGLELGMKEVSKEVKKQLFGLDETIRGCGYSHNTFNVNVERLSDEDEHMGRQKRVTDFLNRNGITNIKFNIVSKSVEEYKRVGARVSVPNASEPTVYHEGTLAGFAYFKKEKESYLCAIFSRHIAFGCSSKLYVHDVDGKLTELGEILEDTLQHGSYDIAAAKIHGHHVPGCDVQFKNSKNIPLPGKLYQLATSIDLQDLHVHLWGPMSTPGVGIIRIPDLSFPDATETYMQIEDRNPSERMAAAGDSGAIICADDVNDTCVHVIAMLIGSITDIYEDSREKRSYIAFLVQKGVELLQLKTGGTFTLMGVDDQQN